MRASLKTWLNCSRRAVQLRSVDREICLAFAEHVYETNRVEYARRQQYDKDMIIRQIAIGKMAELGVFDYLSGLELNPSFPDFGIYSSNKKNFGADMTFEYQQNCINCHIKSQTVSQAKLYSLSWSFQKKKEPLLDEVTPTNNLLVLVSMHDLIAEVLGFIWAFEAIPLYSEPRLSRLKANKAVLYYDDLKVAGLL